MKPLSCLILSVAALAGTARAENLLTTGRFDVPADVDPGWLELDAAGTMAWDATRDADFCSASGVAELVNSAGTGAAAVRFATCAPTAAAGTSYRLGGALRYPPQDREGEVAVSVSWIDAAGCVGSSLGTASTPAALSTVEDQWIDLETPVVSPPGTQSAIVVVTLTKKIGGSTLTAYLDEVFLAAAADLFLDGFQITNSAGDTCRWSAALD